MRASFATHGESSNRWGVAKLVKAPDFDSGIRRFESFFPSHSSFSQAGQVGSLPARFALIDVVSVAREWSVAYDSLMVFTGNANPKLAAEVVRRLNISLGRANVGRFSDGEITVEIQEHVRGNDVFILQSTCSPANENLMELLVMVDALKRASAGRITAAIPYFGYSRQDRRVRSARVPIAAKLVADLLTAAGVQRVLTMDLHAEQIQGFFNIPVDNIYSLPIMLATSGRRTSTT
jgi:phosphoribosylpyrophosphate synthetase